MTGTAVVTGAGRGFGREIARRLAARGYSVLATDIDEAAASATAEEIGGEAWSRRLDVRDPDEHRAAAAKAAERGPLEVWVNNAGVMRTVPVWEHPDEDVRLTVDANLLGVIWGSRAAVESMQRGDILNLGSLSSFGPVPGLAIYGATKHAVLGFSESLQGDLEKAGRDIRVHVLCPSGADTGLVREQEHEEESAIIWSTGPRLLTAEEVADAAVSLIGTRRLVQSVPRSRGMLRVTGLAPRVTLKLAGPLRALGERRRQG